MTPSKSSERRWWLQRNEDRDPSIATRVTSGPQPDEGEIVVVMPVLTPEEADTLGAAYFEGDPGALDRVEPIIKRLLDAAEEAR